MIIVCCLLVLAFSPGINTLTVPLHSLQRCRPTTATIEGKVEGRTEGISLSIPTDLLLVNTAQNFKADDPTTSVILAKCADKECRVNIHWTTEVDSASGAVTRRVDNLQCAGSAELFRDIPILFFALKILQHHQRNLPPDKIVAVTLETPSDGTAAYLHCEHHFYPTSSMDECSPSAIYGSFHLECGSIVWHNDHTGDELVEWIAEDNKVQNRPVLAWVSRSLIHNFNLLHRGIGAILVKQPQPSPLEELPLGIASTSREPDGVGENADAPMIYVHQRAATKRLFPSNLDMFIGGVSKAGEPAGGTLLRELNEECGLDLVDAWRKEKGGSSTTVGAERTATECTEQGGGDSDGGNGDDSKTEVDSTTIVYLGETIIKTTYNHCVVDCYQVSLSERRSNEITFRDGEIEWGRWVSYRKLLEMIDDSAKSHSEFGNGSYPPFVPDGMQVWDALPGLIRARKR